MQLPKHWSDKSLLEYEPFLSTFKIRSCQSESRTRKGANNEHWTKLLIQKLKEVSSIVKNQLSFEFLCTKAFINNFFQNTILQEWLALVFSEYPGNNYTNGKKVNGIRRKNATNEEDDLRLFVDVYWHLYRGPLYYMEAENLVRNARLKEGFVYSLPMVQSELAREDFIGGLSRRNRRGARRPHESVDEIGPLSKNILEYSVDSGKGKDKSKKRDQVAAYTQTNIGKNSNTTVTFLDFQYPIGDQSEDDKGCLSLDDLNSVEIQSSMAADGGPYIHSRVHAVKRKVGRKKKKENGKLRSSKLLSPKSTVLPKFARLPGPPLAARYNLRRHSSAGSNTQASSSRSPRSEKPQKTTSKLNMQLESGAQRSSLAKGTHSARKKKTRPRRAKRARQMKNNVQRDRETKLKCDHFTDGINPTSGSAEDQSDGGTTWNGFSPDSVIPTPIQRLDPPKSQFPSPMDKKDVKTYPFVKLSVMFLVPESSGAKLVTRYQLVCLLSLGP